METNEADAMEAEGAEEEEMMEGEVALQVQGTTFLLPLSSGVPACGGRPGPPAH